MTTHPIIEAMIKRMDETAEGWLEVVSGHRPDVGWADVPMELFAVAALRALAEAEPTPGMTRACIRLPRDVPMFPAAFRAMLLALLDEVDNA